MKIRVNEILDAGLSLSESLDAIAWELNRPDISFAQPLRVKVVVTKDRENLSVEGEINSVFILTCSRCLKEFKKPLEKSIRLFFELKGENTIDISNDIREEILLDYPIKILCSKDCKGLCTKCGKDLNEGPCGCKI